MIIARCWYISLQVDQPKFWDEVYERQTDRDIYEWYGLGHELGHESVISHDSLFILWQSRKESCHEAMNNCNPTFWMLSCSPPSQARHQWQGHRSLRQGSGSSICIKVKNSLFVRSCNTGSDRPNTLAWGSRSGRTLNQTSSHIISIIFAYVQIYFAVLLWLERNRQQECVVYVVCVQRHWSCCFQNCCRSSQLLCPKISWCETFAGSASYQWLVHKSIYMHIFGRQL